jgi:hypothetical protein
MEVVKEALVHYARLDLLQGRNDVTGHGFTIVMMHVCRQFTNIARLSRRTMTKAFRSSWNFISKLLLPDVHNTYPLRHCF